jgi:hypothetical protein
MSFVCADVSDYRDQLARERNARTLTLRPARSRVPSIAQFKGRYGQNTPPHLPHGPVKPDPSSYPFLEPAYGIERLHEGNPKALTDFFNSLVSIAQKTPRLAVPLMKNADFQQTLVDSLSSAGSDELTLLLVKYFIILFPLFPDLHESCVDMGLCIGFLGMFDSQNLAIVEAAIDLVDCISEASGYARDSVLCLGIHTMVIDAALANHSEAITLSAVEALDKIFGNRAPIDGQTLTLCVAPMAQLLSLPYVAAVSLALSCFVSMTNKMASLVGTMYDLNLFPVIVGFLENDALVEMALPLVGNLSVSHARNIETLLECHLLDLLTKLIPEEKYAADVYWVLSNLVESVPHLTIGFFGERFVRDTLARAKDAGFEVKKESGFFLATLIVFTDIDDLGYFINAQVVGLMVQMLGCSVGLIIIRCLDALLRLSKAIRTAGASDDVKEILDGGALQEGLTVLVDQPDVLIRERAEYLWTQVFGDDSPLPERGEETA